MTIEEIGETRTMCIGGFGALPCGGTHLTSLSQVSSVRVRSVRKQKGELKVGYEVE